MKSNEMTLYTNKEIHFLLMKNRKERESIRRTHGSQQQQEFNVKRNKI